MATRIRFSVNSDYVIKTLNPPPPAEERIEAAGKIAHAGYPLGFIIAPIIWYDGWQEGYAELLQSWQIPCLEEATKDLTFEMIQHRFTKTAKATIEKRYPKPSWRWIWRNGK